MFKASKFLAVFMVVLLAAPAWAQAPCPEENQEAKKARALYEEALVQEATGNLGAAREMYDRLVKEHAGTQFACWAQVRLVDLKEGKARINKEGRAQFIIGTTLFGGWVGYSLASMIYLDDSVDFDDYGKGAIWATIGGVAAGLVPAIIFSGDLPMSTGRATLINFGWAWGLWHGLGISILPNDLSASAWFGIALASSAVGWGGTFALTHFVDVADGDAALVASSAAWATWFTFAVAALISEDFFNDEDVVIPVLLAGGDAGLITAALLTGKADMSAGRVGLISLGGMLGMLLSGGIMAVAEFDEYRAAVGMSLALTLGGLAGAYFLTMGYDDPGNGSTGVAALEYSPENGWAIGTPVPRMTPAYVGGEHVLTFEVPLIGGRF